MPNATRHSVYLIAAFFATSTLNYVFSVALSWFFSPAEFGVLGVAQSILLLMAMVVGSGFAWTAAHDVAASGVNAKTRRRFRTAWVANLSLGVLTGVGVWLAYSTDLLPLGPAYRMVIPLVSVTVIVLSARAVFNGVARGLQRFGPTAINLVGEVVFKVAVGITLVMLGGGPAGVMVGFVLGAAASLTHSLWIIRPERMWRGPGWIDREVIRVTIPLFIGLLGTALMLNLDVLGLKLLAPPGRGDELSGYYQAAVILARTPVFLAQALTLVLFSYVAGARRSDNGETGPAFGVYFQSAGRSWFRFLLPVGLVLILAPEAALSLFFPDPYEIAAVPLRVAALGGVLLALVTLLNGVLQGAGSRRLPALAIAAAACAQIASLAWLVPRIGILGAATSLVIAGAVALLGLTPSLFPYLRQATSLPTTAREAGRIFTPAIPLLIPVIPLIMLADGDRAAAVLKLGLAGAGYLVALAVMHRRTLDLRRPMANIVGQFVQVLIGS